VKAPSAISAIVVEENPEKSGTPRAPLPNRRRGQLNG
jgi:hypothetical protein